MPINYFLASIVSYLGLLVGVILTKLAPEEQSAGRKYFVLAKQILFFLMAAFLLVYYKINFILSLFLLLFLAIIMINKQLKLDKPVFDYVFLGIIFSISSGITGLFIIESALIFLYGPPFASLAFNPKRNNYREVFAYNLWFFVPVVLLYPI